MRQRVGLIGCGRIGLGMHARAYQALSDEFEVVAVADPTESRRELAREQLGLPAASAYADYHDLLERDDLDFVDVTTPQDVRRAIVVAAAEAGKDVLAEKPLATVPRDAAEMVATAERCGIVLAVNHNYLFLPENVAISRLIDSGAIGQVEVAIQNFLGVIDHPGAAEYRPRWRHDHLAAGGGVLMDMLHAVYLAERYLGGPIRRVSATVDRRLGDDGQVEDLALCRFEHDQGYALVNVGWGKGPGGIAIMGTEGRIVVTYRDFGTCPFEPLEDVVVVTDQGARSELPELPREYFRPVLADFVRSRIERRAPAADGAAGQRALEAVLAVYESAALERTVDLPLAPSDPVYQLGVAGLAELDLPASSVVRRKRIFGVA